MAIKSFPALIAALALLIPAASAHEEIRKQLDQAIDLMREGNEVPQELREECFASFKTYGDALFKKHEVNNNTRFPEPDRTEFYVNCVRAGLVMNIEHGGWVQRSSLRHAVFDNLVKQVEAAIAEEDDDLDPIRIYGYFLPAQTRGKAKLAAEAFELLVQRDPFLARACLEVAYDNEAGCSWVENHYRTQQKVEEANKVAQFMVDSLYPDGLQKAELGDFEKAPTSGTLILNGSPETVEGIMPGDIIVALNGHHAPSMLHFRYLRDMDKKDPKMDFILWRQGRYLEVAVRAPDNRRLGVGMITYAQPLN